MDPSIKELAEHIANDPSFNEMAEQLQKTLHEAATQDGMPNFDYPKYLSAMEQVMGNPNFRTMAERLCKALMRDSSMSSLFEYFTNPSNKDQLEERMARIKEDPSCKHILDELETGGPSAMMRCWNDEEVLKKLGLAMGINPNSGEAAASSENSVPDETEDVGNEDESIVHQTASAGDVEPVAGREPLFTILAKINKLELHVHRFVRELVLVLYMSQYLRKMSRKRSVRRSLGLVGGDKVARREAFFANRRELSAKIRNYRAQKKAEIKDEDTTMLCV